MPTTKTQTTKNTSVKSRQPAQKKAKAPAVEMSSNNDKILNYAALSRLVLRDLTKQKKNPTFYKYSKDDISTFLKNPIQNEKKLRDAIIYIYNASSHFRRLIQYFVGLSNLSYIVAPYNLDTTTAKSDAIRKQFQKTLKLVSTMDIKSQFADILTVCLREDTFYGTIWATNDNITIQQLPSDYCTISTIEGNVPNVSFDFSYFNLYADYLPLYPPEFTTKFNLYQTNTSLYKWQELASPTSFAIKANSDILAYATPPFVGVLEDLYNLVDYKSLQMTKTELENYAMLILKLGKDKDGTWEMEFEKAKEYWQLIDSQLPEQLGSAISPMSIEKVSFDKSGSADSDNITKAESAVFSSAGVSSQVFNSSNNSSNSLALSIKADQRETYKVVLKIENAINRFLMSQSYSKNFRLKFLDISPFNEKEKAEEYHKAITVGAPVISLYCASMGINQDEMIGLNFLEQDILDLPTKFKPLQSSHTQSGSDGGRPEKVDDLSDNGEKSKEQK